MSEMERLTAITKAPGDARRIDTAMRSVGDRRAVGTGL
jgi:hypothetical protein